MLNIFLKTLFLFLFIFFVTPVGLILRSLGIDYLNKKIDKQKKTYWIKHE